MSFLSTKISILCFEFQARFSFLSKKFSNFVHKVQKNKIKKEEEERMNEVKDENFKHSTYIALNFFYMGQSLPWTNNIVI